MIIYYTVLILNCHNQKLLYHSFYIDSIRIGKFVGLGTIALAKRTMYVGMIVSWLVVLILILICLLLREQLLSIWISASADDEHVFKHVTMNVIYLVCFKQIFYNLFISLMAIFIGLGVQKYTALSMICNFLIGLPLTLILLFALNLRSNSSYYGVYAIWIGNSFGFGLTAIVLLVMLLSGYINWNKSVKKSLSRFKQALVVPEQDDNQ